MDKVSYALGLSLGQNMKQNGISELDYTELATAMQDIIEGRQLRLSLDEAGKVLNEFFSNLQSRQYAKNISEGKAYLEKNGQRSEVVTLPSGLQYEVISQGLGQKPKASDTVRVHYEGRLLDGTVFDSSYRRGEPATFGVTQVIAGWVEALQLMNVGSKWRLHIPSNLAYGEHGAGQSIPPHSTLVFDVELLGIE